MIEPKWISGRKLMDERWHLELVEIIDFVMKGLQPYDKVTKREITPPGVERSRDIIRYEEDNISEIEARFPKIRERSNDYEEYCELRDSYWIPVSYGKMQRTKKYSDGSDSDLLLDYIGKQAIVAVNKKNLGKYKNLPSWIGYKLPFIPRMNETNQVLSNLLDAIYLIEDVENFEVTENVGGFSIEQVNKNVKLHGQVVQEVTKNQTAEYYFRRKGGVWSIRFEGTEYPFRDYQYIRCIALIVEQKGKPIKCMKLVQALAGCQSGYFEAESALDEGLSIGHTYQDDEVTKKKIKRFLHINNKLERETDPLIRKEYEDERDKLEDYFLNRNRVVDKDGRPARRAKIVRKDAPFDRKAQDDISKKLKRAYQVFRKQSAKKLANHFSRKIGTAGNYDYAYTDPNISWDVIWE